MKQMKIEEKYLEYVIEVGTGLIAYGALDPADIRKLKSECRVVELQQRLLEGTAEANEFLLQLDCSNIRPMTEKDWTEWKTTSESLDLPMGWLLARVSDHDN